MGIKCSQVENYSFNSLKELKEYTIIEKKNTEFIPIENYLENISLFSEDKYFGFNKDWLVFNEDGFNQFCRKIKIPYEFMQKLNEQELASKVLNDYISNNYIRKELSNNQFVVNKLSNTIIGIVSNTYVDYSNKDFLEDIEKAYPKIFEEYEIGESFIINTKLYLRLLSPKIISGYAKGEHYEGDDISQIGLQLKNSMIGNSSVKIDYFIYRALCSNGLIVQAFNNKNKILHSGKRESFIKRLEDKINPIMNDMKRLPKLLEDLVSIEYNPYTLAALNAAEHIYKIIQLSDYEYEKRNRLKNPERIEYDADRISRYISDYSGEYSGKVFKSYFRDSYSMFDYINVFTEYAHSNGIPNKKKVYIEEKTGELVTWILNNKDRIMKENLKNQYSEQLTLI